MIGFETCFIPYTVHNVPVHYDNLLILDSPAVFLEMNACKPTYCSSLLLRECYLIDEFR